MSGRKKKNSLPKYFETANIKGGCFIRLYKDLMLSDPFVGLSQEAKTLYIYMLLNRYSHSRAEKAELEEKYGNADVDYFYFNQDRWKKCNKTDNHHYNLFSNGKQFAKYRDELVKAGFIEIVEANAHRQMKNVYKLSDKWKKNGDKQKARV